MSSTELPLRAAELHLLHHVVRSMWTHFGARRPRRGAHPLFLFFFVFVLFFVFIFFFVFLFCFFFVCFFFIFFWVFFFTWCFVVLFVFALGGVLVLFSSLDTHITICGPLHVAPQLARTRLLVDQWTRSADRRLARVYHDFGGGAWPARPRARRTTRPENGWFTAAWTCRALKRFPDL